MSNTSHITHLLDDYLDDTLAPDTRSRVDHHLATCLRCQAEYASRQRLLSDLHALPQFIDPPNDLWPNIAAQLSPTAKPSYHADRGPKRRPRLWRWAGVAAAFAILLATAIYWYEPTPLSPGWVVLSTEGAPRIGDDTITERSTLREGQWLETDETSRAQLDVGDIGQVEVAPNTRLQLRRTAADDHRLALSEGKIEAFIWAPPRLFFVETPAALAVDLGCAYTLTVDSTGTSLLHVTAGYVQLEYEGRETLVPAGAMSYARPGAGPGTAFDEQATQAFKQALLSYDFEDADEALNTILTEARPTDAITLWQLRAHSTTPDLIYDRLADLIAPPPNVTRHGVLAGDPAMLDTWEQHLGLDATDWLLEL